MKGEQKRDLQEIVSEMDTEVHGSSSVHSTDVNRNQFKPTGKPNSKALKGRHTETTNTSELENGFTHSVRSQRSCCSEHDPPPHWFASEVPPVVLHLLGTLLALLAGLLLTVGGLLISMIKTLQPLEISGLRSFVACVYLIPPLLYYRPKHDFSYSVLLETVGVSAVFCVKFVTFSVGSTLLPLSEFSLLCNTVPVFTAFFGCIFLSENCGVREWFSCMVVSLGVFTTFLPSFLEQPQPETGLNQTATDGYALTLLSAMSSAIALCWLRRLKEVHSLLISIYACVLTGAVSLVASYIFGQLVMPKSTTDMFFVCGAAFCMLAQALLPAIACTLTQASRVAVAMTFSVVASFILQVFFQGKEPSFYAIAGGVLIIFAVVIGNVPCGQTDDVDEKEDRMTEQNTSQYGSMSAAFDNSR